MNLIESRLDGLIEPTSEDLRWVEEEPIIDTETLSLCLILPDCT